jgi:hypothetical protein
MLNHLVTLGEVHLAVSLTCCLEKKHVWVPPLQHLQRPSVVCLLDLPFFWIGLGKHSKSNWHAGITLCQNLGASGGSNSFNPQGQRQA